MITQDEMYRVGGRWYALPRTIRGSKTTVQGFRQFTYPEYLVWLKSNTPKKRKV